MCEQVVDALAPFPELCASVEHDPLDHRGDHTGWQTGEAERLLRRLGGTEAEVLRLKHYEDCTFPEIAARLHVPAGTAKAYYYRAMKRLRQMVPVPPGRDD